MIDTAELRAAQQRGSEAGWEAWMEELAGQTASTWLGFLRDIRLPVADVHVEMFAGLPLFLLQRPRGVEVYNDTTNAAVDWFRCLRKSKLHKVLVQLHRQLSGVDLDPVQLVQLQRQSANRMIRVYCWFRLALEIYRDHQRQQRKRPFGRPFAYEILNGHEPWVRELYDVLTDVDPDLPGLHGRLARVQYEHNSWEKIFSIYDTPNTLFWIDAQPGFVTRFGEGGASRFVRRLENLQGSFRLLWWKSTLPKVLTKWDTRKLANGLTLVVG